MAGQSQLIVETLLQIKKTIDLVFVANVYPYCMSQYFIEKSSGRMESGKTLIWKFP